MNNFVIQYPVSSVYSLSVNNEFEKANRIDVACSKSVKEQQLFQALKEYEKRYALTLETINDGVWQWDLISDRISYSVRWKSMVGCKEEEIDGSPVEWLVRVHPADIDKLKQNLTACWQGNLERFEMEYSLLHRDGQYRFMQCKCVAITDIKGKVTQLIGSQTDLTERKQIEAKLNYDALHDRLTNLPDRQLFIQKLRELSQLKQHPDYLFGILCLDLDRFKNVNQNFGHSTGDRLLIEIVRRIQSCLRPQDVLSRLGGDEFAILLSGCDREKYPLEVASRIQQEFSEPIKVGKHSILVTTSIGIATTPTLDNGFLLEPSNDLIESFENAEIAMQEAKKKGLACNKVFESNLYLQNLEKSRSEDDLRKAIEQEQFQLCYQPVLRLSDRQLVGFEALIRWQHPVWGLIPPADFIPLAEDTGLIVPIGWWVLRSACLQTVQWQQQFSTDSIFISVNITSKQFSQAYAGDVIAQILEETGLNPRCLKLEITESEIIENVALVLSTVEQLKCLGVQLSMDDFGTGYSSLSYLHCLPVDTLKIDRCFIQGMERDRHQLELVKTIVKLAEVFELDLVAEGIESELQFSQLLELGCKYGQGYLFSQPVLPTVAATLLR